MAKFLISCAVFFIISCTVNAYTQDPVPVNFLYKSDAVLECGSTGWGLEEIEFFRSKYVDGKVVEVNGEVVDEKVVPYQDKDFKDKVILAGTTLTLIDLRKEEIKPDYYCKSSVSNDKLLFVKQIEPYLMSPERQSQTVTQGGFVEFECTILYGNETDIEWEWTRNGTVLDSSDDAFNITSDRRHSVLRINHVEEEHRGSLSCTVSNKYGSHSSTFILRVKNTLAALWPFLGIVAEVLVLCIIILIYEQKCNKKPKTTAEDNEQTENLMGKDGQASLKKRNPKA